jgi:hypothetical protein
MLIQSTSDRSKDRTELLVFYDFPAEIDGSVQLTQSGDSLRQVLQDGYEADGAGSNG